MLKALKYLKPYFLSVIAIIALIFGQVQCELALPDYMSDIVTHGIQYSGLSDPVPQALSKDTFDHMQYFMDASDQKILKDNYAQADSVTINNQSHDVSDAYVLEGKESKVRDVVEMPFLIVSSLHEEKNLEAMNLTSEDQLWQALEMKPDMASQIRENVEKQMSSYTDDNREAAEIMLLKNEYSALGINMEAVQNAYILHEGLIMLGIAALGSLFAMASAYLASKAATGAARDMRRDVFARVESFSSEEFSRFSTASLITRTTNDIQQIQMVLTMMLRIMLFAPFMGMTSLFKVLRYPRLAAVLGWAVAAMIAMMMISFIFAMPKFRIAQQLVDKLNLVTREQLSGMLVIRAFNNEKKEEKRFDGVNTDITKLNIFLNRLMAFIMPAMAFIMSGVSIIILWIGANNIDIGNMQIGDMMAFLQYSTHVLISFMIVAGLFIMIPRSSVSAKRVFEVLETDPVIKDPQNPQLLPKENKPVVFDHVSFRYPHAEQNVLEDISFTANPGETIAIIGSTGSGKSTLVNLLPRFFDVTGGSIRYGDIDIRKVSQHDLRDHIGYIPQKGMLFSGTIESNLKYADENDCF